jgi:hypothetical protein
LPLYQRNSLAKTLCFENSAMKNAKIKTCLLHAACAACTIMAVAPALATDRVLVMGISDYEGSNPLPGVKFDINNAQQIAKKLGFSQQAVTVLRENDLRKANFMSNFDKFTASVASGDRVFVYYSGHGMRLQDAAGQCQEGLVSTDSGFIDQTHIDASLSALRSRAKEVTVIMDACHVGGVLATSASRGRAANASPWMAKSAPAINGKQCNMPTNYIGHTSRSVAHVRNAPTMAVAAKNYTFIGAATASELAIDSAHSGGVATTSLLGCLDKGVPTPGGSSATVRDLVACAQGSVNALIPQIRQDDGTGWQRMSLTLDGNTDRPLWQVATTLAPPVSSGSADKFAAQVAELQKLQAGADARWGLTIQNVRREMPVGEKFDIPYTAAQGGYFYVLSASSDGEQFKLLYPVLPGEQRYRSASAGKIGGDPPHGTGGNLQISLDSGGALDNHYLVIVSPTPQSYDHLFSTDAKGMRSAKADVIAKFASTTQVALTRQSSATESAPNASGLSLAGTYGAASFMVRRK